MKAIKKTIGRLVVGCVLALSLITNVYGQVPPPPDEGGCTNCPPDTNYWANFLATLETNRQSVLPILHEPLALPNGSP